MKAQLRPDVLMHDVYFRLKFESFRGLWLKYGRDKKAGLTIRFLFIFFM